MQIERVLFPGIPDAMEVGERWQQPQCGPEVLRGCEASRPLSRAMQKYGFLGFLIRARGGPGPPGGPPEPSVGPSLGPRGPPGGPRDLRQTNAKK